jgi:hypothetical protein
MRSVLLYITWEGYQCRGATSQYKYCTRCARGGGGVAERLHASCRHPEVEGGDRRAKRCW